MTGETTKQRVSFVLPSLNAGGMEQASLTIANELAARGYDCDMVLESRQGDYLARVDARVPVHGLQRGPKWPAYAALFGVRPLEASRQLARMLGRRQHYLPLRRLLSLANHLRSRRPDIVFVAHGRLPVLTLLARDIVGLPIRVVIVEHSTLSRWLSVFADEPKKHARWLYRCALARRFYPLADRVVGVSEGVTEDLAQMLSLERDRLQTLYNPVAAATVSDDVRPSDPWFAAQTGVPVVLAVGRLVREKNFQLLIHAFAAVSKRRAVRLMILGEGEQRAALEQQVRALDLCDVVKLPGWVEQPGPYMAYAGVFVLSSEFEGLGIVLIEALARGCPVVSVDCPNGPREILADGRYGRLVSMNDVDALAEGILEALHTPGDRNAAVARAANFSVERGIDRYVALIDALCPTPLSQAVRDD